MASLGHLAVGLAAGRRFAGALGPRARPWPLMVALAALSLLPDLDVVAFRLGIPYSAPFGHRGASHSLAAALLVGLLAAACARPLRLRPVATFLVVAAVTASHPLLDALTDGGLGVALLFPFSNHRYFAPWRPLPVAPLGGRLLGPWGLRVMATELLYFLPLFVYACWRRRRPPQNQAGTQVD